MKTIAERAAKVNLKFTNMHKRVVEGKMRTCVYVEGKCITWDAYLGMIQQLEDCYCKLANHE